MTVFEAVCFSTVDTGHVYTQQQVPREVAHCEHRTPDKASWVIRNSTYYEPDRTHYKDGE